MVNEKLGRADIILKPDGTRITRTSLLNDAINFYQEAYQSKITDICDFSEGSEIRTLHESFLVELFSLYKEMFRNAKMKFVLDSKGTYLDRLGCEFHLTRAVAKHATGSVTFSVDETFGKNITIPRGTIILHKDKGYEYSLTHDVVITSASTPTNGIVESVFAGSLYNAPRGKLTTFQNISTIHRTVRVTNNSPITGGVDEESDNDFRDRILNAKREKSWGTAPVYENNIKEYVFGEDYGVHDVQFFDPKELAKHEEYPRHFKADVTVEDTYQRNLDWSIHRDENGDPVPRTFEQLQEYLCTDCTRVLFVNGTMKHWVDGKVVACTDKLLRAVEYYISLQNNIVIGHMFHVQAAEVVPVYFEMDLYVSYSVSEEDIYTHLTAFFNGGSVEGQIGGTAYAGLNINEGVSKSVLLDVLENVPGVHQVGSLHLLKYNPSLNVRDYAWVDQSDNTYHYTDEEGFTFTRRTVAPDIIDYWGWSNFSKIECNPGCVLMCGAMSDVDSSVEKMFRINMIVI